MQINEIIEDLVTRELKELCIACVHASTCVYHKTATRAVIQCELFETDPQIPDTNSLHGLCITCDHAAHCTLPGRKEGVWRCNEFR
jgi:hypothetical protein